MKENDGLEKLEEKIVFRVSRFFFLTLALFAMLAIVLGVIYLVWGLLPSAKTVVSKDPDPMPVMLTVADIQNAMKTEKDSTKIELKVKEPQQPKFKEAEDPEKLRFQSYMDTLKLLLPENLYPWQSKGYYGDTPVLRDNSGNSSWVRKYITTYVGIIDRVTPLFANLEGYGEYNEAMRQLCSVLRGFPDDLRLEPFKKFIELYNEKHLAYRVAKKENEALYHANLEKIESEYQTSLVQKSSAKYQSIMIIGSAISSMALLSIFLVLLSMQRSIKKITLSEKN